VKCYTVDGSAFSTLEEFAAHFSKQVLGDYAWEGNLDALNDILGGGFGTLEEGFELVWLNSELSRRMLGYQETTRQLEWRLQQCHPENRPHVLAELEAARAGAGSTVFDWLVSIIREHGPGGTESEDNVYLVLR
jgi:RNAse (barnase) inhibitor barstar